MKIGLLLVLWILLLSCENGKSKAIEKQDDSNREELKFPLVVDLDSFDNLSVQQFSFESLIDSLEFVRLETKDNILLSNIDHLVLSEDYLFVYDLHGSLFQYLRNGDFVRRIASVGRGPGQYQMLRGISIDEINKIIYLVTNRTRKILKYSFDGDYLGDIGLGNSKNGTEDLSGHIVFLGDNIFLSTGTWRSPKFFSRDMYVVAFLDSLGNIVQSKRTPIQNIPDFLSRKDLTFRGTHFPSFYQSIGLSLGVDCDTIFGCSKKGLYPRYIIDRGRHDYSEEYRFLYSTNQSVIKKQLQIDEKCIRPIDSPFETEEYLFLNIRFKKYYHLVAFHKYTKQLQLLSKQPVYDAHGEYCSYWNLPFGFVNASLGESFFYPKFFCVNRNAWIDTMLPDQLKELLPKVRERYAKTKVEKYARWIRNVENLKEDDNPVVVIAHLK